MKPDSFRLAIQRLVVAGDDGSHAVLLELFLVDGGHQHALHGLRLEREAVEDHVLRGQ
jgi:hypothetical protein